MIYKNIALFLFLVFFFIEKTSAEYSQRSRSKDLPYLFTGITVCNGSRMPGVKLELFTKYEINGYDVFLSYNYTDMNGVFTLKKYVGQKMQEDLMLYFYYNYSSKKPCYYPKNNPYIVNVSSLNCSRNGFTEGIRCQLKAELQNKTVGTVQYPLVSLFPNKTRRNYKIEKWDIKNSNISFFISKDFDNFSKVEERIINVIKEIENNTCIIFQQQNGTISGRHGINFKKSNECKNMRIGTKKGNSSQGIHLTEECATSIRTIRSLLHQALGHLPSVFREDRNKYVKVDFLYMNLSRVDSFNDNYTYRTENNYTGNFD
uniref:Astacin domain-containing protein n=1 Tax=Parastrongyloides trichosuri TaxID=131310 RepID=A0A0N4Z7H5_PARTI